MLRSLTVVAAHAGEVIHVGYTAGFEGYGNIVDVEVAPGVETLYAHLSAMNVQVGDQVTEGETIGTAGCTGRCYGHAPPLRGARERHAGRPDAVPALEARLRPPATMPGSWGG